MKNLYTALIKFQSQLKPVAKTKENLYFKSNYADLTGLWDAVRSILAENQLAVIQLFDETTDGGQQLVTRLIHSSGEELDSRCKILLAKNDAQSFGSATTYYRRYAFSAILGLTTEEDDDGNAAIAKPASYRPQAEYARSQQDPKDAFSTFSSGTESLKSYPSSNAEHPNCPSCGKKMIKSKFDTGPEYFCGNKKNHKKTETTPPDYVTEDLPF